MTRKQYLEYRKVYLEMVVILQHDLPHVRRVFPCLPYAMRQYCATQLGILWELTDEFGSYSLGE